MRLSKRDLNAFATLLLFAASAIAGDQSAVPQVTVEARVLERKVHTYISNVTAVPFWSNNDPVQLWRRPVCPLVAGLSREEGEYVFDRLSEVLTSIGATRGGTGCHPNFFIVVTSEPEAFLNGVWDLNWHAFGDASPTLIKRFIARPRPVRIWYNNNWASADGTPVTSTIASASTTKFDGVATFTHDGNGLRAQFVMMLDMSAVVAIVDITKVAGLDWGQVTDYIAMAGLTKVDLDADVGDTPTILQLFSTSADSRPKGLSDWDKAFLKELYHSDANSRRQRITVSHRMVQDLARAP